MVRREDIFVSSQYHWWNDWASFYEFHRDLYTGKLLNRTIDHHRYSPKIIRGYALKRETKFLHSSDKSRFKFLDARYAGNYKTCVKSDKIWKAVTLKKIIGSIIGLPRMY